MNARLFALVLRYCAETGNLYWLMNLGTRARAGKVAGNTCKDTGYKFVKVNGKSYVQHRLIWLLTTGGWPEFDVDHIDGNTSNNVWTNLRDVTTSINCKNSSLGSLNTSGYIGISYKARDKHWVAQFTLEGDRYYKGGFKTKEEAKVYRDSMLDNSYHENHGRTR